VKRPYKQGTYTKSEVALLKKEYPAKSAVVLAVKLKRSLVSVQRQLRRLHIHRRRKSSWTPRQLKLLRRIYRDTATWEIANQFNKTPSEVKRKAAELRLKK
jgi:FixJ family two-component response regulator